MRPIACIPIAIVAVGCVRRGRASTGVLSSSQRFKDAERGMFYSKVLMQDQSSIRDIAKALSPSDGRELRATTKFWKYKAMTTLLLVLNAMDTRRAFSVHHANPYVNMCVEKKSFKGRLATWAKAKWKALKHGFKRKLGLINGTSQDSRKESTESSIQSEELEGDLASAFLAEDYKIAANLASPETNEEDDETFTFGALQARQEELDKNIVSRWREKPRGYWQLVAPDYVRRLSLNWPRLAYGTASGTVHVTDINTGETIADAVAHPAVVDSNASRQDMFTLFGEYDGFGVIALEIRNQYVVSAGRDGGATLWRVVDSNSDLAAQKLQMIKRLVPEAHQRASEPNGANSTLVAVVSSIRTTISNGLLQIWTASLDGYLRRWDFDPRSPGSVTSQWRPGDAKCALAINVGSPILAIDILEERGIIACGAVDGRAELFALDTGESRGARFPFGDVKREGVRSVAFVPVKVDGNLRHCLVTGSNIGGVRGCFLVEPVRAMPYTHPQSEKGDHVNLFDATTHGVFATAPPHTEAVVALTSLGTARAGLFASGGRDGAVIMWEIRGTNTSEILYRIPQYKPWLGSLATDGVHLVSDGTDNVIMVLDYSDGSQ